jgi:hypothetical protein
MEREKKIIKECLHTDDNAVDVSGLQLVDQGRHPVLWAEETLLVVVSGLEHLLLGRLQAFGDEFGGDVSYKKSNARTHTKRKGEGASFVCCVKIGKGSYKE